VKGNFVGVGIGGSELLVPPGGKKEKNVRGATKFGGGKEGRHWLCVNQKKNEILGAKLHSSCRHSKARCAKNFLGKFGNQKYQGKLIGQQTQSTKKRGTTHRRKKKMH